MSAKKPDKPGLQSATDTGPFAQGIASLLGEVMSPKTDGATSTMQDAANLISRHKGKLAVGAAAMLGIAAFYHWRESKLAKDDEEEFARLQRLKAALDADDAAPKTGKR